MNSLPKQIQQMEAELERRRLLHSNVIRRPTWDIVKWCVDDIILKPGKHEVLSLILVPFILADFCLLLIGLFRGI